jgi:uncharacterized protein
MQLPVRQIGIAVFWLYLAAPVLAQDPRGHWSGTVSIPNQPLSMEVDLEKAASGWIGSISIPAQNISGLPLEAVHFTDGKVSFRIKGPPGDPTFTGTLSDGGKTLSGDFTQGPGNFPFRFSRTGDPKVELLKANVSIAKEFLGTWEGTLDAGELLPLVLRISNESSGATAVIISPKQNNAQVPVNTIEQMESKLTLEAKLVGGRYEAEINRDGSELSGSWTQAGNTFPLKLKKTAPK